MAWIQRRMPPYLDLDLDLDLDLVLRWRWPAAPLQVHCLRRLSERNLAVEGHGDQDPLERQQRVESSCDGLEGLVHLSLALNVGLVAIVGEAAVCLVIQVVVHARRPGRLGGMRLADLPYREPGRGGELILSLATGLL